MTVKMLIGFSAGLGMLGGAAIAAGCPADPAKAKPGEVENAWDFGSGSQVQSRPYQSARDIGSRFHLQTRPRPAADGLGRSKQVLDGTSMAQVEGGQSAFCTMPLVLLARDQVPMLGGNLEEMWGDMPDPAMIRKAPNPVRAKADVPQMDDLP